MCAQIPTDTFILFCCRIHLHLILFGSFVVIIVLNLAFLQANAHLYADVPDTALIMRRHGVATNLFSCLMFNELEAFNPRDQLAFAYVRDLMTPKIKINMFDVEVFEHIAVEYRHNLKRDAQSPPKEKNRTLTLETVSGSKCEDYLLHMWGESHD